MSFYVKYNRCELIADLCKKGSLSKFFLPFISILIYSSAYKLHKIHNLLCTSFLLRKNNQLSKGIGQFRARSGPIRSDPVIRGCG